MNAAGDLYSPDDAIDARRFASQRCRRAGQLVGAEGALAGPRSRREAEALALGGHAG